MTLVDDSAPAFGPVNTTIRLVDDDTAVSQISLPSDIRSACAACARAAFSALADDHVIPTPRFHRFIAVGRDYFGDSLREPEFEALAQALTDAYPHRFANSVGHPNAEFASTYVFSFIEACVARCSGDHVYDATAPGVRESIDELLTVLADIEYEVVCCRLVTHLDGDGLDDINIGDVTVVASSDGRRPLLERVQQEIPAAVRAFNRDEPSPAARPQALLIVRERTGQPDPFAVGDRLSARLEEFLLQLGLATAATTSSAYELRGMTTLVARMPPQIKVYEQGFWPAMIRRSPRVTPKLEAPLEQLGQLLVPAVSKSPGVVTGSLEVALTKYHNSSRALSPYVHLVDLATALEAAAISDVDESEGLSLRLRSRVAALLASEADPGRAIYNDVRLLYDLRSTLVHGGTLKERRLLKTINEVSTVPAGKVDWFFGIALGHAIDRMRDLARRMILARLALADGDAPLWPLSGRTNVDAALSDDATRTLWRDTWRRAATARGLDFALDQPAQAADFLASS